MSKKLITIIIALMVFLFMAKSSYAQDIEITCGNDGVLTVSPDPIVNLFDEDFLVPGESIQKTIEITNNDLNDSCDVKFDISSINFDENNISQRYFTSIRVNGIDVFGSRTGSEADDTSSLKDLFDAGILDFASISSGNTATIDWVVTFDSSSGNEYQGKSVSFDFLLNFEWGSATDGVEGGSVLGEDDVRDGGSVLGATGEAILIPVSLGIIGILVVTILYKKFKRNNN